MLWRKRLLCWFPDTFRILFENFSEYHAETGRWFIAIEQLSTSHKIFDTWGEKFPNSSTLLHKCKIFSCQRLRISRVTRVDDVAYVLQSVHCLWVGHTSSSMNASCEAQLKWNSSTMLSLSLLTGWTQWWCKIFPQTLSHWEPLVAVPCSWFPRIVKELSRLRRMRKRASTPNGKQIRHVDDQRFCKEFGQVLLKLLGPLLQW